MILRTLRSKGGGLLGAADVNHPGWADFVARHEDGVEIEVDILMSDNFGSGIDMTVREIRLRHIGDMRVFFESCPMGWEWCPII